MWGSIIAGIFFVVTIVARFIGAKYSTSPPPEDKLSAFVHSANHTREPAPRFAPTVSIVIPCYNEEERLPVMLDQCLKFCEDMRKECAALADPDKSRELGHFSDYEIIVVDDCSQDKTIEVFQKYSDQHPMAKMKVVKVNPNRGKGFAVRTGFLAATGDYVLMADGDGATQISDVCRLLSALRNEQKAKDEAAAQNPPQEKQDDEDEKDAKRRQKQHQLHHHHQKPFIGVGSRAHLEADATAQRTFLRTVLMKLFHLVVQITYFAGTRGSICHIHDTQCGFKLFDRRICEPIFLNQRLERFAFDVELFIVSKRMALNSIEVPVNWVEVPGSKVNLKAMAQMGLDCLLMCFTYGFGFWPVSKKIV